MSASKPGSAIFLDQNPKKAAKYSMNAFTGGRDTIAEQKKSGGKHDICVAFEYLDLFLSRKEIGDLKKNCKSGKLSCGKCKQILAKSIEKYLRNFQRKVKKELKTIDKYLMK